MNSYNKSLLILFNTGWLNEEATKQEFVYAEAVLQTIESPEIFCNAFELVNRNAITNKSTIILRESKYFRLRPFRFLINKD